MRRDSHSALLYLSYTRPARDYPWRGRGGRAELPAEAPFLPQILTQEGFTTCAVDNLVRIRPWFNRGYEFYIDPSLRHQFMFAVTAEELNTRATAWIDQHQDEPFFLFIHYWDTHFPLQPPPRYQGMFYSGNPFDPNNQSLNEWWESPLKLGTLARETWLRRPEGVVTDAEYVKSLYDQEVRHVDDGIGAVLAAIDRVGQADETLVMVSADHGESHTEHGIYFEHHGLYEPVIHVPLIMRWPGQLPAGRRLTQMLQYQDVAPTLLEAAGIEPPFEMDGESFWQLASGQTESGGRDRIVSCEATWQAKWSLRTDTHKLILAREPDFYGHPPRELYDLTVDPGEEHNLADEQPTLAAELEEELETWIAEKLEEAGRSEDPVKAQGTTLNFDAFQANAG